MFDDFKNRFSCSLQAIDSDGNKIEVQFFSQYRPEEVQQKTLDIWTYDLIRFNDYSDPVRFKLGNKSFIHPISKKEYVVIYNSDERI